MARIQAMEGISELKPGQATGISISSSASHTRPRFRLYAILFFSGASWALLQLALDLHAVGFVGFETVSVAKTIAASGRFADPFGVPSGPTAHVAPVYPLLMAAAFKTLRPFAANLLITLSNSALLGLELCLLAVLSGKLFGSVRPGIYGALLLAAGSRLLPQHDALFSAVLLLGSALAMLKRSPVLAGLWSGASLLTNPVSLLGLSVLGAWRGWRFRIVAAGVALVLCAPWVLRNWIVLGAPYFIRDNLGLELYISNFDRSNAELIANPGLWKVHPMRNPDESALVGIQGEREYNRTKLHLALNWISSHPGRFVELSALRCAHYWFPSLKEGWPAAIYWAVNLLAAAGVWLLRGHAKALALAGASALYSVPYIFIQTDVRYPIPMFWATSLLAGYAIHVAVARGVKR